MDGIWPEGLVAIEVGSLPTTLFIIDRVAEVADLILLSVVFAPFGIGQSVLLVIFVVAVLGLEIIFPFGLLTRLKLEGLPALYFFGLSMIGATDTLVLAFIFLTVGIGDSFLDIAVGFGIVGSPQKGLAVVMNYAEDILLGITISVGLGSSLGTFLDEGALIVTL